jgi:hypothetical protein
MKKILLNKNTGTTFLKSIKSFALQKINLLTKNAKSMTQTFGFWCVRESPRHSSAE